MKDVEYLKVCREPDCKLKAEAAEHKTHAVDMI